MKYYLLLIGLVFSSSAWGWNPITDVQDNLKWTLGEEVAIGTAYKIGGGGPILVGQRGDSAMLGIFDYRCLKMSYGAISDPQNGSKIGDGLKAGLMLNYFLGWFKSPQTPAMQLLNNINIGPTITIPLLTDSQPLQHPSIWVEANFRFGK
jgi:hypothetical protein